MIEKKPIKCKGINKCKGVDGCGELSLYRQHGLCPKCLYEWMLNNENGKVYKKTTFDKKVSTKVKKIQKKKDLETRESLKSIARLISEARVPFQKWIRLRDANEGCISCGAVKVKIWHGGHYFKAELYTGLVFNEINVNKQCEKCNTFGGGNESGYRLGLIKKYGEKIVKELEESSNFLRSYKFSREEIKRIKTKYQKRLKE